MNKLANVVNILLSSLIQKALPMIVGIIIMNVFGEASFKEFSLFLIGITSFVVFISTGMVPALIKSVSEIDGIAGKRNRFISYVLSASFLWLILSCLALGLKLFGWLSVISVGLLSSLIFVSICVVMILFTISILQALGHSKEALYISVINTCILASFILMALQNSFDSFFFYYISAYFFMVIVCFLFLKKNGFIRLSLQDISNPFQLIYENVREAGTIFLPNIVWMVGMFLFHMQIAKNSITSSNYSSFAIGYQWLTLIVFIPGALAPYVISSLVKNHMKKSQVIKLSLFYILIGGISTIFYLIFSLYIQKIYGYYFSAEQSNIVLMVLISASFAAGNAPLIQSLISEGRAFYIGFGAVSWLLFALFPVLLNYNISNFATFFLLGYIASYIVLTFFCLFDLRKGRVI